jgi:gluconate kinase
MQDRGKDKGKGMTDTDRLDWLEKNVFTLINDHQRPVPITIYVVDATIMRRTVRQAIDEAMKREKRVGG